MTGGRKKIGNSGISFARLASIVSVFCVVCLLFAVRLLNLQVVDAAKYKNNSISTNYKSGVVTAERGEVYDAYGKKYISNVISYNLEINRTTLASGASVKILSDLIDLLSEKNTVIEDHCPLTRNSPYMLDPNYTYDADANKNFRKFLKLHEKESTDLTGTDFYDYLVKAYDIPEELVNTDKGRKIIGIRYDMEVNDFSSLRPYILIKNISDELRYTVTEHLHTLHGIEISESFSRKYDMNSSLCHILGRTGPIYAEEAEKYIKDKGYSYDATVGKEGVESIYEDYLRGIDGVIKYEIDKNNDIIGYHTETEPKPGYSVRLTVDSELQSIIEKSLENQIDAAVKYAALEGGYHTGEDCKAASAVVIDVNSGGLLASASYPGFDLNTFTSDFPEIKDNPGKPLINRAFQGIYPPGSTFKILTAAAALDTGTIDANTYIYDEGEYDKYAPTYTPRCWLYIRNGGSHGYVNVADAIKVSCNYFFYTVADKMGVETIDKYASEFGLGVKTGIELPEEEGILASPEFKSANGYVWGPGDTLQMAIGQSDNAFTPIQLASYMSTVVNGGIRYKTTILKSIDEYYTGEPVYVNKPMALSKTNLSQSTINTLKSGMKSVVDDEGGTAKTVFANKEYANDIGGKTGTAQVTNGSDTVLFVGFMPYENPEIAVAVVVENGYRSSRAAYVAADIFDYYYSKYGKD